jgi:hypothetical protein
VVRREVSARLAGDRGRGAIVLEQAPRRGGQGIRVVIRHSNTGVPNRKRRSRALHGHHGKLAGKRIEHLDRESAFGPPGHPG